MGISFWHPSAAQRNHVSSGFEFNKMFRYIFNGHVRNLNWSYHIFLGSCLHSHWYFWNKNRSGQFQKKFSSQVAREMQEVVISQDPQEMLAALKHFCLEEGPKVMALQWRFLPRLRKICWWLGQELISHHRTFYEPARKKIYFMIFHVLSEAAYFFGWDLSLLRSWVYYILYN